MGLLACLWALSSHLKNFHLSPMLPGWAHSVPTAQSLLQTMPCAMMVAQSGSLEEVYPATHVPHLQPDTILQLTGQ